MSTGKTSKAGKPAKVVVDPSAPVQGIGPAAEVQIPQYNDTDGKVAFDALASLRANVRESELASMRLDQQYAALAALSVYATNTAQPLYGKFKSLDGELWQVAHLDNLKSASFAVLYALPLAELAGAFVSDAKVPINLVQEGIDVERRMQKLCEHHFANDPEIRPILDYLRPGTGHADLADDLRGYARIYLMRPNIVQADPTYYVSTDVADAQKIAGQIFALLIGAMSPKARTAYNDLARAWTVLVQMYDQVKRAGTFVFWGQSELETRFPSLYSVARATSRAKKAEKLDQATQGQSGDTQEKAGEGAGGDTPA